ncbi:Acyl-CoA dehydrogenase [Candidatus Desulfarcum epimagneticum]|uniref:Acyl-CoA dehydrogenase n=1 Tax=uncultured Desulfobacteraceae bacterium TaxID=218296 RepID=A0A484HCX6_9BACT|nr:Acyl-CoA dehydrogenase [uncultured Desulfobacteraceae bacterium]
MDILKLTDHHQDFKKRLKAFLEKEIAPHADQWEKDRMAPRDAWRKMGENGFLCPCVSKEYGGLGGDFIYSVIVADEMAKTRQSGLAATLHSDVVVPYIELFGSEDIKKKYLPGCVSGEVLTAVAMTEPGSGSDLASISTTAVEDGGEVILNGSKTFISNGIQSDLVIVAARNPEIADPYHGISLYLVEDGTPGFKRGRKLDKMGFHSQDTAELFFSGCRIPKENILGEKNQGFLMLMNNLQQERLATSMWAVPIAEEVIALTVDFCKKTLDSGRPLIKRQAVQFALVEMETEVRLGRVFVDKLIADHIEGRQIVAETSMAKYWTTDMAKRVAGRCLELWGPEGTLESRPIERAWRDVRVMSIFAGTNEIMKSIAAKFMGW